MTDNLLFAANSTLRQRYRLRNAGTPTEGNRTWLNVSVCLFLLMAMFVATINLEYAASVSKAGSLVPVDFMVRHAMGIFMILMFLLVDGSPESLSLGMALGFEAVARCIGNHWLTPPYSEFLEHFLYQMGDIFRLYFATQLARISSKHSVPWLLIGTIISIPYGLVMEMSPWFVANIAPHFIDARDFVVGILGAWICARVATAILKDKLPWRILALTIAALAFVADPLRICCSRLLDVETVAVISGVLIFYRNMAYFLYSLAAFVNISTLENRVRALSVARIEEQVAKVREEKRVHEAIVKTTQMLAHDVRKPFSLLTAYMDLVANASSTEEASRAFSRMVPDVKKSLHLVDQMLTNVMEIGRETMPSPRALSIVKELGLAIETIFRTTRNPNIQFHYRFNHQGKVWVDEQHLQRILSNILENAEQAINGRDETITISTSNFSSTAGQRVYVEIQNSGSSIRPEDIGSIFEAFYTKNKRGGTGLGLAIVKKLIDINDGIVTVESNQYSGTSFRFSFPCVSSTADEVLALPASSRGVQIQRGENTEEAQRKRESASQGARPSGPLELRILVVDDDPVYSDSVRVHVVNVLGDRMSLSIAQTYEEGLRRSSEGTIDILICDFDLGSTSHDGVDLINEVKKVSPDCTAVLHTNHLYTEDMRLRLGKNTSRILRKPMGHESFDKLLKDFNMSRRELQKKPLIAIIEDDLIFSEVLTARLPQFEVIIYGSPDEFMEAINESSQLISRFTAIVTDLHFDEYSTSGIDLAHAIRARTMVPIVLYTNAEIPANDRCRGLFQLIAKKSGTELVEFLLSLPNKNSKSA